MTGTTNFHLFYKNKCLPARVINDCNTSEIKQWWASTCYLDMRKMGDFSVAKSSMKIKKRKMNDSNGLRQGTSVHFIFPKGPRIGGIQNLGYVGIMV